MNTWMVSPLGNAILIVGVLTWIPVLEEASRQHVRRRKIDRSLESELIVAGCLRSLSKNTEDDSATGELATSRLTLKPPQDSVHESFR